MYDLKYWTNADGGRWLVKKGFASREEAESYRLDKAPSCALWYVLKDGVEIV